MKKVTLKNNFHGTSVTVVVPPNGRLTANQAKKVRQKLCGMRGCCCGVIRGPQAYGLTIDTAYVDGHIDTYVITMIES